MFFAGFVWGAGSEVSEHIRIPLHHLFEQPRNFHLKAKVLSVVTAKDREVVKALAEIAARWHGCGDGSPITADRKILEPKI